MPSITSSRLSTGSRSRRPEGREPAVRVGLDSAPAWARLSNSLSETGSSPNGSVSATSKGAGRDGAGRVNHDSRGYAVWDWGVATGVFARFKSTDLLNLLENPTLALEGEWAVSCRRLGWRSLQPPLSERKLT